MPHDAPSHESRLLAELQREAVPAEVFEVLRKLQKLTHREALIVATLAEPLAGELAVERLTDRERIILRLRYGLFGVEAHTLQQIGDSLGLSRERARQLEARALRKIRDSVP